MSEHVAQWPPTLLMTRYIADSDLVRAHVHDSSRACVLLTTSPARMSDTLGWIAAGLTVATFSCVRPIALRLCALAADAAFIAYSASAGLWPVLALPAALLRINLMRLLRARSLATAGREP